MRESTLAPTDPATILAPDASLALLLLLLLAGPLAAVAQARHRRGDDVVQRGVALAEAVAPAAGSSSSTHVSLEPPPREELTIIEPSVSATRVSPPGTILIVSPKTAKGRRSTWRGRERAVGHRGRHRAEVDDLLGDPALGLGADHVGEAVERVLRACSGR